MKIRKYENQLFKCIRYQLTYQHTEDIFGTPSTVLLQILLPHSFCYYRIIDSLPLYEILGVVYRYTVRDQIF